MKTINVILGISQRSNDECGEDQFEEAWGYSLTCASCPETPDSCYTNPMNFCDSADNDNCVDASRRNCWVSCERKYYNHKVRGRHFLN